jgi:predicted nucleic acid-binding protein
LVCVDSSVWLLAFRDSRAVEARHLARLVSRDEALLPAVVRLELLSGAARTDHERLRERFHALPQSVPESATWERLESWTAAAVQAGERFGVADLLIAAAAAEAGASVWSLDVDFRRMQRLGFVELYVAPS